MFIKLNSKVVIGNVHLIHVHQLMKLEFYFKFNNAFKMLIANLMLKCV